MQIYENSREFSKVEIYLMTSSPNVEALKNVSDETSIPIDGYLLFKDKNKDGEESDILSLITPDKKVYACQSQTFKRSFLEIFELMDGEAFSIIKKSGVTKSGRDFINCVLDVNQLM
jgi:hypothetical protein